MLDKDSLRKELLTKELTITFTKKDGSERVMLSTLKPDVIVPYEKKTERVKSETVDDNSLTVWSVNDNSFRKISIDKIVKVV